MPTTNTQSGGEFHTIAPDGDSKTKLAAVSGAVVLVAIALMWFVIHRSTSYTPLPPGWGDPSKLTSDQRKQLIESLPKSDSVSNPEKLTVTQREKLVNSLPKTSTVSPNPSQLTAEQKSALISSLFAKPK
jgi:hypothetical protein